MKTLQKFGTTLFLLRSVHCMQRGLAARKLSVHPSLYQTCDSWQNEKSCAHIFIPHERSFILV